MRAESAIMERVFPGCVIGVISPQNSFILPVGNETYEGPAVTESSVYDVASITKSIPTALLALQLAQEDRLSLDACLIDYLPEYVGSFREEIRIRHLLSYTVDGMRLSEFAARTASEIHAAILSAKLTLPPGSAFYYSNMAAYLLGCVVEKIDGPLSNQAHAKIFAPLSMDETTFSPKDSVPTEGGLRKVVHDESARVFAKEGKAVGHAGLFSNVPDLLKVCESLLGDERILSRATINVMLENQLGTLQLWGALGWELNQPQWMGSCATETTFGKTGFTGTSILSDIPRQTAIVILSNRIYPTRPKDARSINLFRRDVCDIVFSS